MKQGYKRIALVLAIALIVTCIPSTTLSANELSDIEVVSENESVSQNEPISQDEIVSQNELIPDDNTMHVSLSNNDVAPDTVSENVSAQFANHNESSLSTEYTVRARSIQNVVDALHGKNIDGTDFPSESFVTIQLMPAVAGYNYIISSELLTDGKLQLKQGIHFTLELNGTSMVAENEEETFDLEIPKDTSLLLRSKTNCLFPFRILNHGLLRMESNLSCAYPGTVLHNFAEGEAEIKKVSLTTTVSSEATIKNEGSMTIGEDASVKSSKSISDCTIENKGLMRINTANVTDFSFNSVSACGIKNSGTKAELYINGDSGKCNITPSYYCAVFNDGGNVTIGNNSGSMTESALFYNKKIITVNNGNITVLDGASLSAVSTTPRSGNKFLTGTTDGTIKVMGGKIDTIICAIITGGTVGKSDSYALVFLNEEGKLETDVSKYQYLRQADGKPISATYVNDSGIICPANIIQNGQVLGQQTEESKPIKVKDISELIIAIEQGGNVELTSDITFDQTVYFHKDVVLDFNDYNLIQDGKDNKLIISSGATVEMKANSSYASRTATIQGSTFLENYGTLNLNKIKVLISDVSENTIKTAIINHGVMSVTGDSSNLCWTSSLANGIMIHNKVGGDLYIANLNISNSANGTTMFYNEGKTVIDDGTFYGADLTGATRCVAIDNLGYFLVKDGSFWGDRSNSISECTLLRNQGDFTMWGGEICFYNSADKSVRYLNHAILYTGEHYPVLTHGIVNGMNQNNEVVSEENPVLGSAVVKQEEDGSYTKGFYKILEEDSPIDGKNTARIEDGLPKQNNLHYKSKQDLLLEVGERFENIGTRLSLSSSGGPECEVLLISSDPKIAEIVEGKTAGTYDVIANRVGYVTICKKIVFSNGQSLENSIRLEVTEDKDTLTGKDFGGSILEPVIKCNAYCTNRTRVPFECHLKSSETDMVVNSQMMNHTMANADVSSPDAYFYKIDQIYIDSPEFNKYFTVYMDTDQTTYTSESNHYFEITPRYNNMGKLLLATDNVNSLSDIEVQARIFNPRTKKAMVIDLGSFSIKVVHNKLTFEVDSHNTLNKAFDSSSDFYYGASCDVQYDNYMTWLKYSITCNQDYNDRGNLLNTTFRYPEGIEGSSDGSVAYATTAPVGTHIVKAEIRYQNYPETMCVNVPIKVVKKYPKVSLLKKTVTVGSGISSETSIPVTLISKERGSAAAIKNVEIIKPKNETSSFSISNVNTFLDERKVRGTNYYVKVNSNRDEVPTFYLVSEKPLNHSEKVKLRVTYHDTVPINGKEYDTILTLNIKTVNQYRIKQSGKAEMCRIISGNRIDSTVVSFTTKPDVIKGVNLTVTDLNGADAPKEAAFGPVKWCNDHYEVTVKATKDTYKLGKTLRFGISIKDENGKIVSGTKVAPMKVSLFSAASNQIGFKKAIMKIPAEKLYQLNYSSRVPIPIPMKINSKNARWKVISLESDLFSTSSKEIGKDAKLYLHLISNKIEYVKCNYPYRIPVTFEDAYTGKRIHDTLTVMVSDPKKIAVKLWQDNYLGDEKKELVLHRNAPYLEDYFYLDIDNSSTKPLYGVGLGSISNVELVGTAKEFYEVRPKYLSDSDENEYYFSYKGMKAPAKKGLKKVKMKISFTGTKKTKTVTVKLRDGK